MWTSGAFSYAPAERATGWGWQNGISIAIMAVNGLKNRQT